MVDRGWRESDAVFEIGMGVNPLSLSIYSSFACTLDIGHYGGVAWVMLCRLDVGNETLLVVSIRCIAYYYPFHAGKELILAMSGEMVVVTDMYNRNILSALEQATKDIPNAQP